LHRARVGAPVALQDLDRRRLPGPVRAQQAEDLALRDLEGDPANGLEVAVALAQARYRYGAQTSRTANPAGGKSCGAPVRAATTRPQSGWCPTTTTGSPRSEAAATIRSAVAPGASRSSVSHEHPSARASADAVWRAR